MNVVCSSFEVEAISIGRTGIASRAERSSATLGVTDEETMPGPLVHIGATVRCSHGGQAQPTMPDPRVFVSGMPVVTIASPYVIAGCPFVPSGGNGPCVKGQWLVGATRVFADGQPIVLQASTSICTPTGTPMLVVAAQTRVIGM